MIKLWDKDNKYIWGRLEGTNIKLWMKTINIFGEDLKEQI